mgnify:CR=1 FL=1
MAGLSYQKKICPFKENKDLSIEDAIQIIADNKSMNQVEIVDEGNSQE